MFLDINFLYININQLRVLKEAIFFYIQWIIYFIYIINIFQYLLD